MRIQQDAPLIGIVELRFQPARPAELGFWLAEAHRGHGLMAEAIALVIDHAFDPAGRALLRLHWEAMVGNDSSARLVRGAGFRFEGTARRSIVFRGQRRDRWQASLLPSDSRDPQAGWPEI